DVLRTVIPAQRHPAARVVGDDRAKLAHQPLGDRLEGSEAVTNFRGMDAGAHAIAVINARENLHRAVVHGRDAHTVGTAHLIGAMVTNGASFRAGGPRGEVE